MTLTGHRIVHTKNDTIHSKRLELGFVREIGFEYAVA